MEPIDIQPRKDGLATEKKPNMKQINNRMTFSSFGGFFAGPPRCATAIVRDGDNTGPGGVCERSASTELLDATIGAGEKFVHAIWRTLEGKVDLTGLEDPEKFHFSTVPVEGALAQLCVQGLLVLEEMRWLCRHRRDFPATILCRTLFEMSCNAGWISASDSEARAASFWEWTHAIERIKPAHMDDPEETARKKKKAAKENRKKHGRNSFLVKLEDKASELEGSNVYIDIYGLTSDVAHGHRFWVSPMSEMTNMGIKVVSIVVCREFVRMAGATAKCCGISDGERSALFGKAERRLEEESRRLLKTVGR